MAGSTGWKWSINARVNALGCRKSDPMPSRCHNCFCCQPGKAQLPHLLPSCMRLKTRRSVGGTLPELILASRLPARPPQAAATMATDGLALIQPPSKRVRLSSERAVPTPSGANLIEVDGKSCTHEVAWPPGACVGSLLWVVAVRKVQICYRPVRRADLQADTLPASLLRRRRRRRRCRGLQTDNSFAAPPRASLPRHCPAPAIVPQARRARACHRRRTRALQPASTLSSLTLSSRLPPMRWRQGTACSSRPTPLPARQS
jgi:hypothetical protein